jgi:hypothetical protein
MATLDIELQRIVLKFAANATKPTLALCLRACADSFSEGEVKNAINSLVAAGKLKVQGEVEQVEAGQLLAVVTLTAL